jgi:mono/diheme cytochrome c family protein
MNRKSFVVIAIALMTPIGAMAEDPLDYNSDIRPILSDKCFFCHGPDASHREADLRLDDEKVAKDWVIIEGKPKESELVRRITSEDESERMPPAESGKELSAKEIEKLKQWIEQGAKYEVHWAYVPPQKHPLPQVKDSEWSEHWIDRFLMARWEKEG